MPQSTVVVSRNGQVHARDRATGKAVGPLLGWVEREGRYWVAQSIAGGRIATEKATRHAALRTLLAHIRTVQTPRLAVTVDTGPIVLQTSGVVAHKARLWGNRVGMALGALTGAIALSLFVYAITLS